MGGPETNANSGYMGTPLANGLFSARQNGGVQEDVFPLNHSTFWSGDPEYRDYLYEGNEGYKNSPETRSAAYNKLVDTLKQAYSEGISKEERDTLMESISGTTQDMWLADLHSAFISAGRMKLAFPELTGTTDYSRILDLDTATSEIGFKKDGVAYQRETFMSNPDNVMVTRITNEAGSPMGMELSLQLHENAVGKSNDNKITVDKEKHEVVMTQRAPYDFGAERWDENRGTLLEARAKVVLPDGGDIQADGTTLKVSGAKEILVLYTCETSFKDAFTDPSNSGVDYSGKVRATLDNASEKTYDELRERHLEEYRSLFRRFWIDMEGSNITAGNGAQISPYEYARHYQYGRYINISCERANSVMPHGLLGMWSTDWKGPNEGAYFLNENMEKMQAIKGAGNLADSSDSQYNYITSWTDEQTGQRTAQNIYGAEDGAWMMSHSTGIWAKSGMWGGTVEYGSWLAGGIWALDSLYDKYDFTEDVELLKAYYPLLEGAAKFALSTLIDVDGVNGELKGYKVVAPSGSPEHWYWVGNTKVAFDVASVSDTLLYYNLFNMMERGARDLKHAGISYDESLLDRVLEARSQMMPLEMFIDENTGRLKEWYNEYQIGDARHRHASHLLGLFLGHININEADTPELYYAQQAETERWITANGGTHPDRSLMAMRAGFEDFAFANMTCGIVGTGYNHGAVMQWMPIASSIAESAVDSRFDQINLMENLPSAWSSGTIKGIRARGGYQLSMTWENGELINCVIDSPTGETPRVLYRGEPVVLSEDVRFTVNRAATTLDELTYEAQEKLEGKYTEESKKF
ncbi:glycosyl hydrolase family 95 catalytic domain-containing protein [Faecalicatena contorta]|uniref:glycosyl hydrolase family 95 catalytic domain-containing protein n=1 Tax=Faecalicatena contorta TaxID=39482 RepID=UPI0031D162B2